MDNLRDSLLYVPFYFSEVRKLLISKGAKLVAKGEVSATAILVAGIVVLGPEVPFVTGFELVNYTDKVFMPIIYVLADVELRRTLELHFDAAPFTAFYLSCGEVMEGNEYSFNVVAEDAASVPVAYGLCCTVHTFNLGGDVLRSGFVFHQPVDAIELDLKVKLTVEDEVREFNTEGLFDVDYFHHRAVASVVVVVLKEGLGTVIEGTVIVFVEGLLLGFTVPSGFTFVEGVLKCSVRIIPALFLYGLIKAVEEAVPSAAIAQGIGAEGWDKVTDIAPVILAEARTGTGPTGVVDVELSVSCLHFRPRRWKS